ncbi:hypothetical protein CATRI_03845 [Corynebacterium atrinae]|uniref:DUF6882 domain-containing protein n=1 Tax=Corynebacterium atrinae TaxID=1336740 RepID=UPI0025B5ACFA|nr:DUF6882 domain-containing protein [Corynebacterium atrinae]WJY62867.1 hypothetical protein CATRI_03845 [Corynebacterium atrinae]
MVMTAPTTLADVVSDGALLQPNIDAAWRAQFGQVTDGVEFSGSQVRLHRHSGGPVDLEAIPVATIQGEEWTWISPLGEELGIPELHGTVPASDQLIAAARTLHANVPVLLAPTSAETHVVAVRFTPTLAPVLPALSLGVAEMPEGTDVRRALRGFATAYGLDATEADDAVTLSDGTTVTLVDGRVTAISGGMSLEQVRADAHYLAAEHQLLVDGRFPEGLHVEPNIAHSTALINGSIPARAVVVATVTDDVWTWGWADPNLPPTSAANLRRFGIDNGIPELFRAQMPAPEAHRLGLVDAIKPILGWWTHSIVRLTDHTVGIVLIDAPELHLPAPSDAAVAATLQAPLPEGIDAARAEAAYRQRRGLS